MGDFGHIKTTVKSKLFKQYCCYYYGAPLWDLQSKDTVNICRPLSHGTIGQPKAKVHEVHS